jgi:hypothetical protein
MIYPHATLACSLLTVENTAQLAAQPQGGSWSSCPSGTWARQNAVHVACQRWRDNRWAVEGEVTHMHEGVSLGW